MEKEKKENNVLTPAKESNNSANLKDKKPSTTKRKSAKNAQNKSNNTERNPGSAPSTGAAQTKKRPVAGANYKGNSLSGKKMLPQIRLLNRLQKKASL